MDIYSPENYYKTTDIGLASALVTFGFDLIDIDKSIPFRVVFIFLSDPHLDEKIKAYWSEKLKVSARRHFENLKMLKNQIYSIDERS